MIYEILNKTATFQRNGSGWYFKEVLHLETHTVDYKPMNEGFLFHSSSVIYNEK